MYTRLYSAGFNDEEGQMRKICILDGTGHSEVATWEPGNADQMAIALQTFERLKSEGRAAFRVSAGGEATGVLDRFDETAEEIVFIRPLVGG